MRSPVTNHIACTDLADPVCLATRMDRLSNVLQVPRARSTCTCLTFHMINLAGLHVCVCVINPACVYVRSTLCVCVINPAGLRASWSWMLRALSTCSTWSRYVCLISTWSRCVCLISTWSRYVCLISTWSRYVCLTRLGPGMYA